MENVVDLDKFAQFVIEKWQTKIITLGITDTRQLLDSFSHSVTRDAAGNPQLVKFVFDYYGKFLDMGVFGSGRRRTGTKAKHYRKTYPWYSSTFARQVRVLADLLAKQYGYQAAATIAEGIMGTSIAMPK